MSESTVYHVVAALLDAVECGSVAVSSDEIHRRAETRPATAAELAEFDAERYRRGLPGGGDPLAPSPER